MAPPPLLLVRCNLPLTTIACWCLVSSLVLANSSASAAVVAEVAGDAAATVGNCRRGDAICGPHPPPKQLVGALAARGFSMLQRKARQALPKNISEDLLDGSNASRGNSQTATALPAHSSQLLVESDSRNWPSGNSTDALRHLALVGQQAQRLHKPVLAQTAGGVVTWVANQAHAWSWAARRAEEKRTFGAKAKAVKEEARTSLPGGLLLELRLPNTTLAKLNALEQWDSTSDFLVDMKNLLCDAANISEAAVRIHSIHEGFQVPSIGALHNHSKGKEINGINASGDDVKGNKEVVVKMLLMTDVEMDAVKIYDAMREALTSSAAFRGPLRELLWHSKLRMGAAPSTPLTLMWPSNNNHIVDAETASLVPVIIFAFATTALLCFCSRVDSSERADGSRRTIRAGVRSNFS